MTRARVVDEQWEVPGLKRAFLRTLTRLIEVNPFMLGGIPAGIIAHYSKQGQRLGDMAGGTWVVASRDVARRRARLSGGP